MKEEVKTTERGWASHFICSERCTFHRSTLIEYNGIEIVVSSVGAMFQNPLTDRQPITIGADRYYETMVWYAKEDEFKDADVYKTDGNPLDFDCPDEPKPWDEINANNIHEKMVEKWKKQIKTLEK